MATGRKPRILRDLRWRDGLARSPPVRRRSERYDPAPTGEGLLPWTTHSASRRAVDSAISATAWSKAA